MVTHVTYSEEVYGTPSQCLLGIRAYLERGWELSQLNGRGNNGPFVCVFRLEDEPQASPTASPNAATAK